MSFCLDWWPLWLHWSNFWGNKSRLCSHLVAITGIIQSKIAGESLRHFQMQLKCEKRDILEPELNSVMSSLAFSLSSCRERRKKSVWIVQPKAPKFTLLLGKVAQWGGILTGPASSSKVFWTLTRSSGETGVAITCLAQTNINMSYSFSELLLPGGLMYIYSPGGSQKSR